MVRRNLAAKLCGGPACAFQVEEHQLGDWWADGECRVGAYFFSQSKRFVCARITMYMN